MNKTEEQRTVLEIHKSTSARLEHIEKLLLGLATLGLTGWGLLLVAFFEVPDVSPPVSKENFNQLIIWIVFSSFFSGLVGSAYAGLYIARMTINRTILEMEPYIESSVRPFTRYFEIVGKLTATLVYFATGLFLPFLSMVSLGITSLWLYDVSKSEIPTEEVMVFIWLLICTMALSVISLSIVMAISILKQLKWRSEPLAKQNPSTLRLNATCAPGRNNTVEDSDDPNG